MKPIKHSPEKIIGTPTAGSISPGLLRLLSITAVILSGLSETGAAPLINIQLAGTGASGTPVEYSGSAAIGAGGDKWNKYDVGPAGTVFSPSPSGPLVDSTNSATGVSFTLTQIGSDSALGTGFATGGNSLMDGYAFVGPVVGTQSATLTLSGLTSGGLYDIYLFSGLGTAASSGFPTTFTVNSIDQSLSSGAGFGGTFIANQNYVLYSGVVATGGTIAIGFSSPGSNYGVFNGLQLNAVPEPSVAGLFVGAGIVAFLLRRLSRQTRI